MLGPRDDCLQNAGTAQRSVEARAASLAAATAGLPGWSSAAVCRVHPMKSTSSLASRCQLAATRTAISIAAFALALSGCGGSDDDGTTAARLEDAGPVRFLSTSYNFRSNQLLLMMSFEGGLTYGFYQADFTRPSYDYAYDGMFVVSRLPGARSSDPTIGLDHDFQNGTTRPATLALATPNEAGIALGALTTVTAGPPANTTVTEPIGAWESDNASLDTNPTTLSGTYAGQDRQRPPHGHGCRRLCDGGHAAAETEGQRLRRQGDFWTRLPHRRWNLQGARAASVRSRERVPPSGVDDPGRRNAAAGLSTGAVAG